MSIMKTVSKGKKVILEDISSFTYSLILQTNIKKIDFNVNTTLQMRFMNQQKGHGGCLRGQWWYVVSHIEKEGQFYSRSQVTGTSIPAFHMQTDLLNSLFIR